MFDTSGQLLGAEAPVAPDGIALVCSLSFNAFLCLCRPLFQFF